MKAYVSHLRILQEIRSESAPDLASNYEIICEAGEWLDCAVLKLRKPSWSQGNPGEGVFFSVWIGEKDFRKQRFNYNIHALKLRLWKSHAIKPREFAANFRRRFNTGPWPNVSTDFGPQTLMQGWMPSELSEFRASVRGLMDRFVSIHTSIDEMLEKRKLA